MVLAFELDNGLVNGLKENMNKLLVYHALSNENGGNKGFKWSQ